MEPESSLPYSQAPANCPYLNNNNDNNNITGMTMKKNQWKQSKK